MYRLFNFHLVYFLAKIRNEYKMQISPEEFGGPFELKLNLKSYEEEEEYDKMKIGMVCWIVREFINNLLVTW